MVGASGWMDTAPGTAQHQLQLDGAWPPPSLAQLPLSQRQNLHPAAFAVRRSSRGLFVPHQLGCPHPKATPLHPTPPHAMHLLQYGSHLAGQRKRHILVLEPVLDLDAHAGQGEVVGTGEREKAELIVALRHRAGAEAVTAGLCSTGARTGQWTIAAVPGTAAADPGQLTKDPAKASLRLMAAFPARCSATSKPASGAAGPQARGAAGSLVSPWCACPAPQRPPPGWALHRGRGG